jgi:hypothetical protein
MIGREGITRHTRRGTTYFRATNYYGEEFTFDTIREARAWIKASRPTCGKGS